MLTLSRIDEVRRAVAGFRREGLKVGLVPTMGNLHDGHLSLVRRALAQSDRVIVSVFVNPTQFGPGEDFERYPRTLERDRQLLAQAGAQLLFSPPVEEIYPDGPAAEATRVSVAPLSAQLEGAFRPGHFDGVATVVAKLFHIVAPDLAVFGEKDFQQLAVIRRMVRDLCMPVEVVGAPTVRAPDGLALSSRNQYLSEAERAAAPALQRALRAARERILGGERDWAAVEAAAIATLAEAGFVIDYVALRAADDLSAPRDDGSGLVILAAARLGSTRLIDNLRV